ncbi:L-threonylcarbamoyladenylate synthase [Cysteiniphilum litorale]|uniref:L-threonylcarbamoyladenylate synthase n=1 Tax=Cysteiniphilum litorale TaxID=2056700 RepID=UPI003F884063
MSQYIEINPYSSNKAVLAEVVNALNDGKVIAYPTDSGYALGCKMGLKKPLQQIKKIRDLNDKHNFTIICRDLSEIAQYAKVDNSVYRLLKRATPGGYTFILQATSKVPGLMLNKSKKTVGIRVPDHPVPLMLSEALGEPLLSTTFILPDQDNALVYSEDFANEPCAQMIDYILESDYCGYEPTTVVDMTEVPVEILRVGSGDISIFE